MAKDPDLLKFFESKREVIENLEAIKTSLTACIDEGLIDDEDAYYNELLDLIDDAHITDSWYELLEIITKAKTLEIDIATWLAIHGRTSISLPWPKKPPNLS